jgi:hypothetical protein
MKKLELKDLGVQEMNTAEMTNVEGGLLGISIDLSGLTSSVGKLVSDVFAFLGAQVGLLGTALKAL